MPRYGYWSDTLQGVATVDGTEETLNPVATQELCPQNKNHGTHHNGLSLTTEKLCSCVLGGVTWHKSVSPRRLCSNICWCELSMTGTPVVILPSVLLVLHEIGEAVTKRRFAATNGEAVDVQWYEECALVRPGGSCGDIRVSRLQVGTTTGKASAQCVALRIHPPYYKSRACMLEWLTYVFRSL